MSSMMTTENESKGVNNNNAPPALATAAVLVKSELPPKGYFLFFCLFSKIFSISHKYIYIYIRYANNRRI